MLLPAQLLLFTFNHPPLWTYSGSGQAFKSSPKWKVSGLTDLIFFTGLIPFMSAKHRFTAVNGEDTMHVGTGLRKTNTTDVAVQQNTR